MHRVNVSANMNTVWMDRSIRVRHQEFKTNYVAISKFICKLFAVQIWNIILSWTRGFLFSIQNWTLDGGRHEFTFLGRKLMQWERDCTGVCNSMDAGGSCLHNFSNCSSSLIILPLLSSSSCLHFTKAHNNI